LINWIFVAIFNAIFFWASFIFRLFVKVAEILNEMDDTISTLGIRIFASKDLIFGL